MWSPNQLQKQPLSAQHSLTEPVTGLSYTEDSLAWDTRSFRGFDGQTVFGAPSPRKRVEVHTGKWGEPIAVLTELEVSFWTRGSSE